ncbi:MAG TPA: aspartate aminotransferase family protein [Verrucomicrobiae bacterium]|nr:aspartate aminotransferase family protein [Verrucomicrobiae bacterium]
MKTKQVLDLLRTYESRNVLFMEPDGSWPIVWERAKDVHVWDADGKKYLDLSGAFGVAAAGHANANVVQAGQKQMARLLHAMGDVHPHALKAQLARELSRVTFERWTQNSKPKTGKTIFCNSGFEAVEAALKTAVLATKKNGVIAFSGAYHGLGYGALNVTHRDFFRSPFQLQLREFGHFVLFPTKTSDLVTVEFQIRNFFRRERVGTILVEPVQARGGINVPPGEFLPLLRKLCDEHGALLILDEIYTGFGRTGKWFACEHSGTGILPVDTEKTETRRQDACATIPDLICLGKALTGGFPLSACVGRAEIMDAWPISTGEAIHTSTFLGHPVGCAMALAQIAEIGKLKLPERSAELGKFLLEELSKVQSPKSKVEARGLGLMAGIELRLPDGKPATEIAVQTIKTILRRGYIMLPEGEFGNVISFTPPLTISKAQLARAVKILAEVLATH